MKKLLLAAALIISGMLNAQNFPGKDVQLLVGKELKVIPQSPAKNYDNFYADAKFKKNYKEKDFKTPHDKIAGKIFKVLGYEPYAYSGEREIYVIKLENAETGIIYYRYNPQYKHDFHFEVIGGLTYPEGYFCDKVKKDLATDKELMYSYPDTEGVQVTYFKKPATGDLLYFTVKVAHKLDLEKGAVAKGITLTFDNGKTIEMADKKLDTATNAIGATVLTGYIGVTMGNDPEFIKTITESKLVKVKLHTIEKNYTEGGTLQQYLKCAIKH